MPVLPRSLAVFAVLATLTLAGCGGEDDAPTEPVAGESPQTSAPATPDQSSPPSAVPTPSESPSPATLTDRLLPTASVPGLNATWTWQDGVTGPAPATPFETCSRASLSDIGASEVVTRTYFPPDDSDDNAGQQVAVFPDAKTAATAWSVLGSWRARCGEEISSPYGPQARAFVPVPIGNGVARWYLVTIAQPEEDTGRFVAIGMVKVGTQISVLQINNSGQDYNYPRGKEPMVAMVRAAAGLLG